MTNAENLARIERERRIVQGLIRHMKDRGWLVFRTYDGEAFEYPKNEAEALGTAFAVAEISLRFIPARLGEGPQSDQGARRRWVLEGKKAEHGVLLVMGNDQDIISDWNYSRGDPDGFSAAMDAFDAEKVLR
jgi:hypothetical protein